MNLLIEADKHSAPVTHLGSRILWTIVTLLVLGGIYLLMWRGWKRRQAGQADIPPLNPVPGNAFASGDHGHSAGDGIEATYVSSTSEGDWLDRIAVHGLGNRSDARVHVAPAGILIEREPDLFIPADAVRGVKLATGMAGKFLREEGIVVITWQHGDRTIDSGVKPRYENDRDELLRLLETQLVVSATEGHSS